MLDAIIISSKFKRDNLKNGLKKFYQVIRGDKDGYKYHSDEINIELNPYINATIDNDRMSIKTKILNIAQMTATLNDFVIDFKIKIKEIEEDDYICFAAKYIINVRVCKCGYKQELSNLSETYNKNCTVCFTNSINEFDDLDEVLKKELHEGQLFSQNHLTHETDGFKANSAKKQLSKMKTDIFNSDTFYDLQERIEN